ncbi:MAG TPA: CheR family methyltransferase [Myxococcota bacterium]|nr:CheR family methyltransferase [Myxococcota bacterium]
MNDAEFVAFLQWALPRVGLRWEGFRKVRRRVERRLARRMRALRLPDWTAYRQRLEKDDSEWEVFDAACRLTISRFWRDHGVFDALARIVLPTLAELARARGENRVRCWSAGCASGEEAYSVRLAWEAGAAARFPGFALHVVGTDADPRVLTRARLACFLAGALRDLPSSWTDRAFERRGGLYCLRASLRSGFEFRCEDLRRRVAEGNFHLVLCRNVAFTYFGDALQRKLVLRIAERIPPGGALLLGAHERLPAPFAEFVPWPLAPGLLRRTSTAPLVAQGNCEAEDPMRECGSDT